MKTNVAVVGMGYWGKNLVRNFNKIGVLSVVCDSNKDVANTISETYPGVRFATDYNNILIDDSINAVVLATPAVNHYIMAMEALEAGKDVYVEKPLALDVKEGEELLRLAARTQRILMVGHILQYHSAVVKLKQLIRDGVLGKIQYLYSNRLNMGKIRTEENILWSFAPHDISVMLGMLNEEPCEITCQGADFLLDGVADVTMSQFVFPSGVHAHIFVSWLHPIKEQRLVVVGSEKMAIFDDTANDKLVLFPHRVEWKNRTPIAVKAVGEVVSLEETEPLRNECQHFLDCIESRTSPITDGSEGVRVLKILKACQSALEASNVNLSDLKAKITNKLYFVHETSFADEPFEIGEGTKILSYSHIGKGAKIGKQCILGQNCNVAHDVVIGNNVKIQNNVSISADMVIEDDVFLGSSCVFSNFTNTKSKIIHNSHNEKTIIHRGAIIGSNATIVGGIELGRYCFIAPGAVVTSNVPDYALIVGNPARQEGWMSLHGHNLGNPDSGGFMICPESGYRYQEIATDVLKCLDFDEEAPFREIKP